MLMRTLHIQYGAAFAAAPVFCLIYGDFLEKQRVDMFWLLFDLKSLFFLVFFYPVAEELLFRGFIQEYLHLKTKQFPPFFLFSIANILTSIVFALMHLVYHAPFFALLTFVPSLLFGYFKDRYNHVLYSIVLHMFYNACYFSLVV
jgi:membrane protease YdiL (CAAX protease family)